MMSSPPRLGSTCLILFGLLVMYGRWMDREYLNCIDTSQVHVDSPLNPPLDPITSSANIDHAIRKVNATNRELPGNKVFITGPWVPEKLLKSSLETNPDLEFHVFNYSAVARSVRLVDKQLEMKANVTGAWEAWNSLRSWSYRADLWRYMILWSEGGIYVDSKIKLVAPVSTWASLSPQESLSCCHDNNMQWNSTKLGGRVPVLSNGVLSARKGSPALLEAIEMSIKNVQSRSYYLVGEEEVLKTNIHADLSITGPILLGYVVQRFVNERRGEVRVPCGFYGLARGFFISSNQGQLGRQIIVGDQSEHRRVRSDGNSYGPLWGARRVYCDGPYQPTSDADRKACDTEALLPELYANSTNL